MSRTQSTEWKQATNNKDNAQNPDFDAVDYVGWGLWSDDITEYVYWVDKVHDGYRVEKQVDNTTYPVRWQEIARLPTLKEAKAYIEVLIKVEE